MSQAIDLSDRWLLLSERLDQGEEFQLLSVQIIGSGFSQSVLSGATENRGSLLVRWTLLRMESSSLQIKIRL